MTNQPDEAAKRAHRISMLLMAAVTVVAAAVAVWILGTKGDLPGFFYGGSGRRGVPLPAVAGIRISSVPWRGWEDGLREARGSERLLLLDLTVRWARPARLMDSETYADPAIDAWLRENVVPVRVDGDERPDVALRYLSGGWPTTALLLPSGEILAAGTFIPPDRFQAWVQPLANAWDSNRESVLAAQARAAAELQASLADAPRTSGLPRPEQALAFAKDRLERDWDAASGGWSQGPRFPHFERIAALAATGDAWALERASAALQGARALEDPVWGGFFRYAAGPGWQEPAHEKVLQLQAEGFAAAAALDPGRARRTLGYVRRFLTDPKGGYLASQAAWVARDGKAVEGWGYYGLDEQKRLALGLPETYGRVLTGPSARMARAVLEAPGAADAADSAHALRTLERLWAEGFADGALKRRLGGPKQDFLTDYAAFGRASVEAAARDRSWLDRAVRLARAMDARLKDPASGALFDRPPGLLGPGVDRVLDVPLNTEAARFLRALAAALPGSHPYRAEAARRAAHLASWVAARPLALDPADWAAFTAGR